MNPRSIMPGRIATLTLNPAVDIACSAAAVQPTHKVRTDSERYDAGGGGINVARVVHALGGKALALIMTGGVTGRLIEEMLDEVPLPWTSFPIQGRTRISLNVRDRQSGLEYRFVPEGPTVTETEWQGALEALRHVDADWIVASGSLPPGVPASFYGEAAAIAAGRGQEFALDSSGAGLSGALGGHLSLLKLSIGELEFLVGRALQDEQAQAKEASALVIRGVARIVAVSLGNKGALLADAQGVIRLPTLDVTVRSTAGAGDSFLAGLVLALSRGLTAHAALAYGIATGAAAVMSPGTAHVTRMDVERLHRKLFGTFGANAPSVLDSDQ